MFFESGLCDLPLSAAWHPVRDSFRVGRARDAFEVGGALAADAHGDRLLWAEVLLALGRPRHAQKALAGADHWAHALIRALGLCREGRLLAADRLLDGVISGLSGLPGTLALAMRARVLAQMQREEAARRLLDDVARTSDASHPWVLFERASAWMALRRWAQAADLYTASRAACPDWARPAFFEAHCRAALGSVELALTGLAEAAERFPGFPMLRWAYMAELVARDRWDGVLREVDALLAAPPPDDAEAEGAVRRALEVVRLRTLWRLGDRARVLAEAERAGEHAKALKAAAERGGARARLAVLPLVQERSMCVAASLAMVMRFHGHAADPAELYRAMSGHEGVHDWQLDRWLLAQGWTPLDLKREPAAVRWAVENRLPVLATRNALLMAHMEVVAGYDDALEEVDGIDPGSGGPVITPYAELAQDFTSLVAVVPPGAGVPDAPIDAETSLVRRARRAAYAGDPDRARELLADLGPGGPSARLFRLELADTFCSEQEVEAAARAIAEDQTQHPEQRLRGALVLRGTPAGADLEPLFASLLARLTPFHRRWVRLHDDQREQRWDRVLRATSALVERAAHVEAFWSLHARALRANGRLGAARTAQDICLEISPLHLAVVLDPWRLTRASLDLKDERARLEKALALYPLVAGVAAQLWYVLLELGDVSAAEAMLADARRRMPAARVLADLRDGWLLNQGRPDLAAHPPPPDEKAPEGPPEPDAPVTGELIERWMRAAAGEVAAAKRGPYLERLIELDEDGRLKSDDQLTLSRLELWLALAGHPVGFDADAIRAALPAELGLPVAERAEWLLRAPLFELVNGPAAAVILEWLDRQTNGRETSAGLRYLRASLLEQQGRRAEAEAVFGELVRDQHHVPALAHAIDAALNQEKLGDALAKVDAMLGHRPGNVECWAYRATVAERLGDAEGRRAALTRLVALRPYCGDTAQRLIGFLFARDGAAAVRAWLAANRARYRHGWLALAEARTCLAEGRPAAVTFDDAARETDGREVFRLELEALALQEDAGHRLLAVRAADTFPDDAHFVRLAAEERRAFGVKEVTRAYDTSFRLEPTIEAFIGLLSTQPDRTWQAIADALIDDPAIGWRQRDERIRVIAHAVSSRVALNVRIEYLRQVRKRHRDSTFVLYALALHYHEAGSWKELENTLELFMNQCPGHAARIDFAAGLMDRANHARALELCERLFQLTGRPSALERRAALYLNANKRRALEEYRRVLSVHPSSTVAIANLVFQGEDPAPFYDGVCAALALPLGADVRYFLVAAVHVARAAGRPLPAIWGVRAMQRLRHMRKNDDGYHEHALKYMLARWAWKRDERQLMTDAVYDPLERAFVYVNAFLQGYAWNTDWIPAPGSGPEPLNTFLDSSKRD